VSCNYLKAPTDVTVYLTKGHGDRVEAAMAEAKRELLQFRATRHPTFVSDARSNESGLAWMTAFYALDGGFRTGIWMTDLDGWTLEYRATYATADEATVISDLKAFTAIVQQTAGAQFDVCSKSVPPARRASAISDKKDLEQSAIMTSVIDGALLSLAQQGKETPAPPTIWCVEQSLGKPDHAMLFWRGVGQDGADLQTDRITLATMGPPPTLVIAPDSLAGFVESQAKGNHKAPRWAASMENAGGVLIYGYFDGRPSKETVANLFESILSGQARSIGGYGANGKTITIQMAPKP
jgi:hypothetical protein